MTGFNDLPNEIILELWEQLAIQPDDIGSFALVSKRIFAFATPYLRASREHHRLKFKYAVLKKERASAGSMWAQILKDILLHPHIALYIKDVSICNWNTRWDGPDLQRRFPNRPALRFHLPYPEQDMELFKSAIRNSEYVDAGEVDKWIQLLESGHEYPILVLLLSLLPNLCTLSQTQHPRGALLSTAIRRISDTAPSTSFSRLRNVDLAERISRRNEGMALIKPFLMLPSVEKLSCRNLDFHHRGSGTPDCLIAPHSSNVTELILDSCRGIVHGIATLFLGIKRLKSFTYLPTREEIHIAWILSALLNHCRNSLECLTLKGYKQFESNYIGKLRSLRLFETLKTLDVQYSLLVGSIANDNIAVAELLPTSIEAFTMRGQDLVMDGHICPLIRKLVDAKRRQLPNLKNLTYHSLESYHIPLFSPANKSCLHIFLAHIYPRCDNNHITLDIQVFHPGVEGPCRQIYESYSFFSVANTRTILLPPYNNVQKFSPKGQCCPYHN